MFCDLLKVLEPEISGERILEEALALHEHDRWFTFPEFEAERAVDGAADAGGGAAGRGVGGGAGGRQERVRRLEDADGVGRGGGDVRSGVGEWRSGAGGRPGHGAGMSGDVERADAAGGGGGGVVVLENSAELAKLPDGALAGKIAFISFHPHRAKRELARLGVVGILTDYIHPSAKDRDATAWINSFSDDPNGWAFHEGDTPLWSFQMPPAVGERVRARLAAGETLRGRALVKSKLYPGKFYSITGVIPGTGKEEVALMAHSYENGVWDNASGVTGCLEAARALTSLIAEGKLAQPERSIRVLIVSEIYSSLHYWLTTKKHRKTVAAFYLDAPVVKPEFALAPMEVRLGAAVAGHLYGRARRKRPAAGDDGLAPARLARGDVPAR